MNVSNQKSDVIILGIYASDLAFKAPRLPKTGETLIGSAFSMGPGGKGANQAVAAARAGASTAFITRLGRDSFGDMALENWAKEGICAHVKQLEDSSTGAAFIFINDKTGENAIIVVPGAASTISTDTVDEYRQQIEQAKVFITQLEQPPEAAEHALRIARDAGTITIFNPAPAEPFDKGVYSLCDYITPNESEAEVLTGIKVESVDDARKAGDVLLEKGAGAALITLGESGALYHDRELSRLVPATAFGKVIDTTGAGDAFNGCFAAALARGEKPLQAVKFANVAAGISVTRQGTAPAMPELEEIVARLNG